MALTAEDRCSFCGKRRDQVKKLVAGQRIANQTLFICNECVTLAAAQPVEYVSPRDPTRGWPPPKVPGRDAEDR